VITANGPNGVVAKAASFQGPLPPPGLLAEYEQALPGCAERIVKAFEEENAHRRAMDVEDRRLDSKEVDIQEKALTLNGEAVRRGQWMAFVTALLIAGVVGGTLAWKGYAYAAMGAVAAPFGGATGIAFLLQKRAKKLAQQADEDDEK